MISRHADLQSAAQNVGKASSPDEAFSLYSEIVKPRIYVETTIPSFYYEVRNEPEMIARRKWTRKLWEMAKNDYELVTSLAVVEELERGDFPGKADALALISDLPLVALSDEIDEIVDTYIASKVMPSDPRGDALHLALASVNECEFLLTWNCKHLANANKFGPHPTGK